MATHIMVGRIPWTILAWRIPWTKERVEYDLATNTFTLFM